MKNLSERDHSRKNVYVNLQKRLDGLTTGAPNSPVFQKILRLLFTPEEARMVSLMGLRPVKVSVIAHRVGKPLSVVAGRIKDMANRGLILDLEVKGETYAMPAPVVIGFYEFTFMRVREDLNQGKLAHLFEDYMAKDDKFARSVFEGSTQIGRTLPHKDALPSGEILDWHRADQIVSTASFHAVSLCSCRHEASLLGTKKCDAPLENCLSLNDGGRYLAEHGLAREITASEAMTILENARSLGLAQTADNVRKEVSYICNCCGDCCNMFRSIRTFGLRGSVVSAPWYATVGDSCVGCGICEKACPVGAIKLSDGKVTVDEGLCLGCGVCATKCPKRAITLRSRDKKIFTPEDTYERILAMAIERGKLCEMVFDDPTKLSHRALGKLGSAIEKSKPVKALMAVEPLKSAFLTKLANNVRSSLE